MTSPLRPWKCMNCGRANLTVVALDGTAKCDYCSYSRPIQPSRIRNGVTLPASYPVRPARPASTDRS